VVGDSVRDIRAARAANARPLLVRTGKGARTLEREAESLRQCAGLRRSGRSGRLSDRLRMNDLWITMSLPTSRRFSWPSKLAVDSASLLFSLGMLSFDCVLCPLGGAGFFPPFRPALPVSRNLESPSTSGGCASPAGIDYRVSGTEHIPDRPVIVMAKHQSTWETLFLQQYLPPMSWVVKRELFWLPFFGWALALLRPIAINRQGRRSSAVNK
jgi:hypothetical protein